ncbi:hypothetical protein TVAG_499040 [Trichomonas vaginalis G3]|uniref:Uncharacterized protein n=1 Tax=Trichomonas vaginalis (strain ATCC PRA-98 / G3) TaxID=412133 RepID=A2FCK8_TRIV3|nr:hypothetical protein TVAGG3_0801360 [Trichomonas vaginalis G3]EAX97367.1 hypothetical protein TVAG_499040 [Trichomonas vaginalis G3]KAI5496527.1 hypothetical protein TVAGG3_0801360 [Trichomonas vaginalis G3]|eukprot:XP_001310297.1 hypothetical protein [Trichomonas vaginalis G3]
MSRASSAPLESMDNIKACLKGYSRLLRRDFLAILVKMTAKEFGIRTVRCDWRTRKGMFAFLQGSWERFHPLLNQPTVFNWYCTNFDSAEKLFSNRKFVMFIYANWKQYESFLTNPNTILCIKSHSNGIETLINSPSVPKGFDWLESEPGKSILEIVHHFKNGQAGKFHQDDIEIASSPEEQTPEPMKELQPEPELNLQPEADEDHIDLEYAFFLYPQDYMFVDFKKPMQITHIDDPFLMDEYSL